MNLARLALIVFYIGLPASLFAELKTGDLPAARWYAHVDLVEMRSSVAGRQLYDWLDEEVFEELREEIGFDADKEANSITALATSEGGTIVVIDGDFSDQTADKIVAIAALASDFDTLNHDGKAYYQIEDEPDDHEQNSFDNVAFMSVALKNKLLVTASNEQMQQLLSNNGKIPGNYDDDGALFVLRGDKSFVQAGMQTSSFDDMGWDSNILRNTKQLALLVSDSSGLLAVQAELIAAEAEMANSLASIARGLISLAAFSDEVDPEIANFLNATEVEVSGSTLTVSVTLDAEILVEAMD
jgi:hypothetical protein